MSPAAKPNSMYEEYGYVRIMKIIKGKKTILCDVKHSLRRITKRKDNNNKRNETRKFKYRLLIMKINIIIYNN